MINKFWFAILWVKLFVLLPVVVTWLWLDFIRVQRKGT